MAVFADDGQIGVQVVQPSSCHGSGGLLDRYYQTQDDPYLETRAREEQFVQQIVDAVRDALRETMPVFLAGCMTGMAQNPAAVSPQPVKEPVKDSINWDFVGG